MQTLLVGSKILIICLPVSQIYREPCHKKSCDSHARVFCIVYKRATSFFEIRYVTPFWNFDEYCAIHCRDLWSPPSRHTTSNQRWFNVKVHNVEKRRFNVDSTSRRWNNVECMVFQRCVSTRLFSVNLRWMDIIPVDFPNTDDIFWDFLIAFLRIKPLLERGFL